MIFKSSLILSICLLVKVLSAYDLCKDNKDVLEKYKLFDVFSGNSPVKRLVLDEEIPYLSYKRKYGEDTIDQYWLLSMCGNEVSASNDKLDFSKYETHSIIYGVAKSESSSVYNNVINIKNSDLGSNKVSLNELPGENTGLNIFLNNVKSTSFNMTFQCDNNLKKDEFRKIEKEESFDASLGESSVTWRMSIIGPSGCLANGKDNKPIPEAPSKKPKHSFFKYFFIYVLVFTMVYIGVSSYIEIKDGGTLQDFEDVFKYKFKELMFSIPAFSKELYNKIVGNNFTRYTPTNNQSNHNDNHSRDGYAAV